MRTASPRRLAAGLLLTAALVATSTACGAGDPEPGASETGGAGLSSATLTFGVQSPPNSLDPFELHDGEQRFVWGSLFDTLLTLDFDGELQPNAAESWEYSDDALTLTLTLRDDLTFSSADPITAADVKGTLERTMETPGPQQGNLSAVGSIDAPDERTVVINLTEPDDNLLPSLALAAGVIGDPESLGSDEAALDPVESGPYELNSEQTQDGTVYVLDRRDDHWNASDYPFASVTIRPMPDRTARFNALMAGEIDAATVDQTQADPAEGAGLSLSQVEGASLASLVLADRDGTVTPALADERVRRAISLTVDRAGMVNGLLAGNGEPSGQMFHPLTDGYVEELDAVTERNVEQAKELMAEAGYADGFELAMPSTITAMPFEAALKQAFADIGIDLTWDPVPPQTSTQSAKWSAYWNIGGAAAPSRMVAQFYAPDGSNNPFGSTDPELDSLLAEVAAETDPERAAELYAGISRFGDENAWFAPAMRLNTVWATQEGIEYVGTAVSPMDLRVFGITE